MRIRQVKPSFWSDARLAELSDATRLFYIGVWMLADDAGWMRFDVAEVAHQLYGYEQRAKRERRVRAMWDELAVAGRVVDHPCGHAEVPTLVEHQRFGGTTKQVRTFANEHLKSCVAQLPRIPAGARESSHVLGSGNGTVSGSGTVRNGTVRNVSARESATTEEERDELLAAFARRGLPVTA